MTVSVSGLLEQARSDVYLPVGEEGDELRRLRHLTDLYRCLAAVDGLRETLREFSTWLQPHVPHQALGLLSSTDAFARVVVDADDADALHGAAEALLHGLLLTGRSELHLDTGLSALLLHLPDCVPLDRLLLVAPVAPRPAARRFLDEVLGELSPLLQRGLRHDALFQQSRRDPLTGLPNRRLMDEALAQADDRARRYARPAVLMALDLDGFKRVNDQHGHDTGDRVLVEVAGVMARLVRGSDVLARVGGDEFALLLPETELAAARGLAARLETGVAAAATGAAQGLGVSIGLAAWQADATPRRWWKAADDALYAVKARRHGRVTPAQTPSPPPVAPRRRGAP